MKRIFKVLLPLMAMLFVATSIHAQAPTVTWDDFFPGTVPSGNYTADDVKESPYGDYVMVGTRNMTSQHGGYRQAMLMRVDQEGYEISMNQIFGGTNSEGIPWDQELNDMIFTPLPHISYLVTGYRDTTLTSASTPPGLLLMEIWGNGAVLFDSLYHNNNLDWVMGRCIQPAIGGGYIIAGSIREDGGAEKIMMVSVEKNQDGKYDVVDMPYIKINEVGENGYASWIRQFGDGYVLGGSAYNGLTRKTDLFIQKVGEDRYEEWTTFYGTAENDDFADALISNDTIFIAGTVDVLMGGYYNEQIYVVKARADGTIIWEKTYGGARRTFAKNIIRSGDGNLLLAGSAYDASMHSEMLLLKIDAENGDSLWMESYGDFYNAGIRDIIPTSDFGYLAVGRASFSATQNPQVYVMKLNNSTGRADLSLAKEDLGLAIVQGTPTKDVINVTGEKISLFGICVKIDSLLHPSVGDLELTLEHDGTEVTLVNQALLSGENFIHTNFIDGAEARLIYAPAPYSGWFMPEQSLSPFLLHAPTGEWTLTVTDHGTGGTKATTRILEGWSLNLLTESGGGTSVPDQSMLMNFGLDQVRPNPVDQQAVVSFQIPHAGHVKLSVFNQLGQLVGLVADEDLPEGVHERMWHPGSLAPGTYFFHLESGGLISVRKAILSR